MTRAALRLDPKDNVLIALKDLRSGDEVRVDHELLRLTSNVPAKFKFAAQDLPNNSDVLMYGLLVGKTRKPVSRGEVLTTANLAHEAAGFRERDKTFTWNAPDISRWRGRTFAGFPRSDGQVGSRNYWLVVPLVFCENRNLLALKHAFEEELGFAEPSIYRRQVAGLADLYRKGTLNEIENRQIEAQQIKGQQIEDRQFGGVPEKARARLFLNVDGIKFLFHEGGCGGTREDSDNLCGLLAGYVHHPNVAGATVLSLGCQNAQIDILHREILKRDPSFAKPLFIFEQQRSQSESAMMSAAIRQTFSGLVDADKVVRQPASFEHLCVGLKCGGSDGFSGISANPALGHASDLIAAIGGRTILSEFPELCGVEQELINRCSSDEAATRFAQLMRDYAARTKAARSGFEMNPSPGNIRDGLITDAMKSAGAARKGGTSPVNAVLDYPEYSHGTGLSLQCTPGNDVECVTAQVGAGANVVVFTTGLGTPTGNPVAPVVKVSTNSDLAQRMPDIIDIDAGGIISGEKNVEQMGEEILDFVARVASGEVKTKAETLQQDDFIPWKRGVSL